MGAAIETLKSLGATTDEAIDLAEGALALAAVARPSVSLAPYREHLSALAGRRSRPRDRSPTASRR